jgi:hypothetical protein
MIPDINLLKDLFVLLLQCVARFKVSEFTDFRNVIISGFVLGIVCWTACSYYSRLWNLKYRIKLAHHILCGIAAILTLIFTVVFAGLKYTKEAAYVLIDVWQYQVKADSYWGSETFQKVYDEVKALGIEDFTNYPSPAQGGHTIPATQKKSYETVSRIYAAEAVQHFKESHPYLSKILWAASEIPAQAIRDDIDRFFTANPGGTYSAGEAINLAAEHIREGLNIQVPRVVPISRWVVTILFFLIQSIPFGLIGYSAYKDLKIHT